MRKLLLLPIVMILIMALSSCSSDTGVPDIKTMTSNLENAGYDVVYHDYKADMDIKGEALTAQKDNDYIIIVWFDNRSFKEKAPEFCAKVYPEANCVSNRTGVYYCSTPSAMQAAGITPIKIG